MLLRPVLQPCREETGRQQERAAGPHRPEERGPESQDLSPRTEDPRPALHPQPEDEGESGARTRGMRGKDRPETVPRTQGTGTATGELRQGAADGNEGSDEAAERPQGEWILQ